MILNKIMDVYTDYLITQNQRATATGLSEVLEGEVSHDQITRCLNGEVMGSKELWKYVKPIVRQHETDEGFLLLDDSIEKKPYSDENLINSWHYSHTENRVTKGINIVSCLVRYEDLRIPISYEMVEKDLYYCDMKTHQEIRQSSRSKNDIFRDCIAMALHNGVKFKYVLADIWFASRENMEYIEKKQKFFIFGLKANRLVAVSQEEAKGKRYQNLESLDFGDHTAKTLWLRGMSFPVKVAKKIFTNEDGSVGVLYLVSNDLSLDHESLWEVYKKRWAIEEFHKSIKQNASLEKSPAWKVKSQCNHIFASMIAFCKLEVLRLKKSLNHFALKYKLVLKANQAAMRELNIMRSG
jgi:hypothetical protein